ncbi:MAG TPA: hypothetical protein VEZ12_02885, partial [Herpetosiphonaceae bacterium]|nr:hypothetical protein [Herpetosiphonaceae bacterium]
MTMDDSLTRALAEWSGFYTLLGGAAATLLGLLFVALSLRLNVFRDQELADVHAFATFTFSTFLVAIVIAALAVAPHERGAALVVALGLAAATGLSMTAWVSRVWMRLNRTGSASGPGPAARRKEWVPYFAGMCTPYLGVLAAAVLVGTRHPHALGWLAISESGLLVLGTVAAWVMLSHA